MQSRFISRLGEFDVPERLSPLLPTWVSQIAFAAFCLGVEAVLRLAINLVAPGAGPFALIYPAALVATLFAGWPSGALVLISSEASAWYFVLNRTPGFTLNDPTDGPRLAVTFGAGVLIVVIAEAFRRVVRTAVTDRNAQLEERDLFLREVDHRVRNNFAVVASLLDMQRRRAADAPTRAALTQALSRIDSIARAHRHLYRDARNLSKVQMKDYLGELCQALADALFLKGAITLTCLAEPGAIERDRAVTIGLVVNELVTNAAKHAFEGRESGAIRVTFAAAESGWRLVVEDDGCGIADAGAGADPRESGQGLGRRLIEAFARQADGAVSVETGPTGSRITLDLAP